MLLYYVRHGEPIYQPDSLTEKGKQQAAALAQRLQNSQIDEIYASSSNRAVQTAQPLAEQLKKEIRILDFCNENYAWKEFTVEENGRKKWVYQSEEMLRLLCKEEIRQLGFEWYRHPAFADGLFEQGMERIGKNTDEFLEGLGYRHDRENHCYRAVASNEKRIALFAHEGFSHAFLPYVLDIPYPLFAKFEYEHTGVSVIWFDTKSDGTAYARLLQYSSDAHLVANGPDRLYNGWFSL